MQKSCDNDEFEKMQELRKVVSEELDVAKLELEKEEEELEEIKRVKRRKMMKNTTNPLKAAMSMKNLNVDADQVKKEDEIQTLIQ